VKIGQYELLSQLGAGGMGQVWRAVDPRLGREVAIKILSDATAADAEFRARFLREARMAARLNHPNIATIFAVEERDASMFLVMELVDGLPLTKCIADGPLSEARAIDIARQAASAIAEAHAHGVVHRDIKPDNIMLSSRGVKVLDFGIARDVAPSALQVTQAGMVLGTPAYMSPEQAQGRPVDATSDVFSLGVVLYEMLSGQLPFTGDTVMEVLVKLISCPQEPLTGVTPALAAIVHRCLEKKASERFQNARELDAALANVRSEAATRATVMLPSLGPRALVADDDPMSRRLMRAALEQLGYQVDEAADGAEAVRFLKIQHYETMITDLLMPRLDGWEVLDFVRTASQHRPEHVFVSSTIRNLRLSEVDQSVVEGIVAKPIRLEELRDFFQSAAPSS
jgi:serine/threonine protein kinase